MAADVRTILANAAHALGADLTDPVDLGGSARTTVLRCTTDDGGTVIVKAHANRDEYFANEAAGLAFTHHGPELLAVDPDTPLVVMADLGNAPSLADRLLATSPEDAETAVLTWATGYGRIAAETSGRRAAFDALRAQWDDHPPEADTLDTDAFTTTLDTLDVRPPAGLAAELTRIADLDGPHVFSPGDICPDNNALTPDGLRVIDFEDAGFHPVFLDAAYTRMPFSTCWCVYRMPAELRDRAEAAYRSEVAAVYRELADDDVWNRGLQLATAYWTIHITYHVGPKSAETDGSIHPGWAGAPMARQLLRYRWQHAATELANTLPAFADTARGLLAASEHWAATPLPHYPAFTAPARPPSSAPAG